MHLVGLGEEEAWTDRIHRDALLAKLRGERARETGYAMLGSGVGRNP